MGARGLGLGGGVIPLVEVVGELQQSGEWGGTVLPMEEKNQKSAKQGRGWSGVELEVKLRSRLVLETSSSVPVTSSTRSASRDSTME